MNLRDAEKTVQAFGSILASESEKNGPAYYASRLPESAHRIMQAMKLWLAYDHQNGSLTEEFCNEIGTAASRLPRFIEDEKARRLNAIYSSFYFVGRSGPRTPGYMELLAANLEVEDWMIDADITGSSLISELSDFIATIKGFNPTDSLYTQRIGELVGDENLPIKKQSFWQRISSRITNRITPRRS